MGVMKTGRNKLFEASMAHVISGLGNLGKEVNQRICLALLRGAYMQATFIWRLGTIKASTTFLD